MISLPSGILLKKTFNLNFTFSTIRFQPKELRFVPVAPPGYGPGKNIEKMSVLTL